MFRYSPRRSRSRGFKVKHVLQLFLLVSVSIWLLYQIKHSREQKSDYEESARSAKESIKLGRKDLLPRIDDTITKDEDRDNNIIVDHFKPEGTGSVEIKAGVGDGLAHENHVRGEVDSRWKPLYGKREREREDSAKEETEEGKEEESKEEETEETHEDKETEEGKESGEENEGEENKEEGEAETEESENKSSDGNDAHDEPAREMHYKGDESESHNATTGSEHNQAENSHEFVKWSNTNSTEAYIHQDERARNMRETETEAETKTGTREGKRNRTIVSLARLLRRNNSTAIKRNATNLKSSNISSPRNLIARVRNSTLNRKEAETRKYNSSSTEKPLNPRRVGVANSTYPSRKFMFRRQSVKSNASSAETGKNAGKNQDGNAVESRTTSNTKNTTDSAYKKQVGSNDHHQGNSSVSQERDESAGADDVQKLKEMVDYSSVIKKEDESPDKDKDKDKNVSAHSDSRSQEDGEGDNGVSDESSLETSNPQEEKDGMPDLKTMAGSVAEGRSSQ